MTIDIGQSKNEKSKLKNADIFVYY